MTTAGLLARPLTNCTVAVANRLSKRKSYHFKPYRRSEILVPISCPQCGGQMNVVVFLQPPQLNPADASIDDVVNQSAESLACCSAHSLKLDQFTSCREPFWQVGRLFSQAATGLSRPQVSVIRYSNSDAIVNSWTCLRFCHFRYNFFPL